MEPMAEITTINAVLSMAGLRLLVRNGLLKKDDLVVEVRDMGRGANAELAGILSTAEKVLKNIK